MFNFQVYAYLFKIKSKIPDFERGKAKISTGGVYQIFRVLKSQPDLSACNTQACAEIGKKVPFRSLRLSAKAS